MSTQYRSYNISTDTLIADQLLIIREIYSNCPNEKKEELISLLNDFLDVLGPDFDQYLPEEREL